MKVVYAVRTGLMVAALAAAGMLAAQSPDSVPAGGGPEMSGPAAGGPGFGEHRPPFERALGHGRFWDDPAMVEKLKLTDDQRKQMDDILQQHKLTLVDLNATVEKAELALKPLIDADQPDETKILAQIDQVAQARAELEKANARFLLAIRAKLTPEQWKALQAERANRPHLQQRWAPGAQMRGRQGAPDAPPPPGDSE